MKNGEKVFVVYLFSETMNLLKSNKIYSNSKRGNKWNELLFIKEIENQQVKALIKRRWQELCIEEDELDINFIVIMRAKKSEILENPTPLR